MPKDTLFTSETAAPFPFAFTADVAAVFEDMLRRSVPLYGEALNLQVALARRFYVPGTRIYDLGCSHGNFGITFLEAAGEENFEMISVDNSRPMLEVFEKRLAARKRRERISLLCEDIARLPMENASVILMNLTLQFLPVEDRERLLCHIHKALVPGGIFLLTEKVVNEDSMMKDFQQEFYYGFKAKNGYSALEISKKREALENVLIPETVEAHMERLERAGFRKIEIYLKWFHFTSFLALKENIP